MSGNIGVNNETLKRKNRGLILQLILSGDCVTRTELTRRTGLSKMSVSNVISEFIELGVVRERAPMAIQGQGRNPIELCLSPDAPRIIGLHIFQGDCVAVRCNLQLQVEAEYRFAMNEERAKNLEEELIRAIDHVMPGPEIRVLGIGIGSTGPVAQRQGRILNALHLYGVHDVPIAEHLAQHYNLPVAFDSQYNCTALAEKYFGAGRPYEDFLFVGLSMGVGSGVIAEGKLLRNAMGLTSELGHTSIDWRGNLCRCGRRGCLETYVGSDVMEKRLREISGVDTDFAGFCWMMDGDQAEVLRPAFDEMSEALACALTSAVNMLNPQAIILGHDGALLPQYFLEKLEEQINSQKLAGGNPVKILRPGLGPKAQVCSSACCLLAEIFEGRLL